MRIITRQELQKQVERTLCERLNIPHEDFEKTKAAQLARASAAPPTTTERIATSLGISHTVLTKKLRRSKLDAAPADDSVEQRLAALEAKVDSLLTGEEGESDDDEESLDGEEDDDADEAALTARPRGVTTLSRRMSIGDAQPLPFGRK